MSMIVNRRDLDFLLYEMLDLEELLKAERYSDYDRSSVKAILDTAEAIAEERFLPCAATLDANEPEFLDGAVRTIPEVKQALNAYRESGLFAAGFDYLDGGMQLPWLVTQAMNGIFICANTALSSYPFLTTANANLLNTCGSAELKARYLKPLLEGRWYGTMCLSEPQAGSSLADITTKAIPLADGSYKIAGTKMWISGGDQDISENIIHMVLAKIPGSPPGVKGISLFLVPKFRVDEDGCLGDFNHVVLAGLNHKMGHRGTTNTLLNFSESGDSIGYLVGEVNGGLANMFHMMNEARVAVGMSSVMSGLGGYLYSLDYARNRPQGRPPGNKDPELGQVMIVEHADVKRMLMTQKAFVEGGLALILYCALLIDKQKVAADPKEHNHLALLLEILTPIAKSWPSEYCLEANKLAIQVLGGYGYTRDYPVERFYRDNRLNHIHEGTHAIHGIDMLGRKVRMNDGAALRALQEEIFTTIRSAQSNRQLAGFAAQLEMAWTEAKTAIDKVSTHPDQAVALANATLFLDAFGHIVVAWLWLWQATRASDGEQSCTDADKPYYRGKLAACKFFFTYELPKVNAQFELVSKLDSTCVDLRPELFIGA